MTKQSTRITEQPTKHKRPFRFKQFEIYHNECAMKVGTDGVLLGAWAAVEGAERILDIGTGTGLIAIMCAQRAKNAVIDAIDIDEAAFRQAAKNSQLSPWHHRIFLHLESAQNFTNEENKSSYQSIVCNPPFFNNGTASHLKNRHLARHTVTLPYVDLLQAVQHLLHPMGHFSVILPHEEGLTFIKMAATFQLFPSRLTAVHSKAEKPVERLLIAFQKQKQPLQSDELVIQFEARNDWTPAYIALTKDFYLKM